MSQYVFFYFPNSFYLSSIKFGIHIMCILKVKLFLVVNKYMDSLRPLIFVNREGMRQSLVGIFATENVFVLARMPNAILAGQRLWTNVPIDVQLAETQDRIGAMPDHSAKESYRI